MKNNVDIKVKSLILADAAFCLLQVPLIIVAVKNQVIIGRLLLLCGIALIMLIIYLSITAPGRKGLRILSAGGVITYLVLIAWMLIDFHLHGD